MLTWTPAGDVPVACLRGGEGYCPSQGGGQNTPFHWDRLRVNCGYVFANTVRYINSAFKVVLFLFFFNSLWAFQTFTDELTTRRFE